MKKIHFWTSAFITLGIVTLVASSIWFNKYPNLSEYIIYVGGAIILLMFAGWVEALKRVFDKQGKLEINQMELQRWVTEQEKNNEE